MLFISHSLIHRLPSSILSYPRSIYPCTPCASSQLVSLTSSFPTNLFIIHSSPLFLLASDIFSSIAAPPPFYILFLPSSHSLLLPLSLLIFIFPSFLSNIPSFLSSFFHSLALSFLLIPLSSLSPLLLVLLLSPLLSLILFRSSSSFLVILTLFLFFL